MSVVNITSFYLPLNPPEGDLLINRFINSPPWGVGGKFFQIQKNFRQAGIFTLAESSATEGSPVFLSILKTEI